MRAFERLRMKVNKSPERRRGRVYEIMKYLRKTERQLFEECKDKTFPSSAHAWRHCRFYFSQTLWARHENTIDFSFSSHITHPSKKLIIIITILRYEYRQKDNDVIWDDRRFGWRKSTNIENEWFQLRSCRIGFYAYDIYGRRSKPNEFSIRSNDCIRRAHRRVVLVFDSSRELR